MNKPHNEVTTRHNEVNYVLSLISTFSGNLILVLFLKRSRKLRGLLQKLAFIYHPNHPYLKYCNVAWSSTYCCNLITVFTFCKST